jgi:hypothetical protein
VPQCCVAEQISSTFLDHTQVEPGGGDSSQYGIVQQHPLNNTALWQCTPLGEVHHERDGIKPSQQHAVVVGGKAGAVRSIGL